MSKILKNFAAFIKSRFRTDHAMRLPDPTKLCSVRGREKQLFKVLLFINGLLLSCILVLSQVTNQIKNEGGIIASTSREQLFSAIKDAISEVEIPDGVISVCPEIGILKKIGDVGDHGSKLFNDKFYQFCDFNRQFGIH